MCPMAIQWSGMRHKDYERYGCGEIGHPAMMTAATPAMPFCVRKSRTS